MITVAYLQPKQPNVFYKKGVLKHFTKFIEKHLRRSFFNKITDLRLTTLLKQTPTQGFSSDSDHSCNSRLKVL